MPKTNEIREDVKYSNAYSASGHETAVTISAGQIRELLSIMDDLGGEQAINEAFLLTEQPDNINQQDFMLRSTLRFYSNVRFLVSELKQFLCHETQS